jgi:ABC-type transport system involved in cytochrome c biogenesis permease component
MALMVDPVLLAVYALAFARLVYLVTIDTLTEPIRDGLIEWLDDRPHTMGSFVAKLITCPWCASVWMGAVAAPLVWFHGDNPLLIVPALVFALSQVAGMLSDLGR